MLAMLCFAVPCFTHAMVRLTLQDAQQEAVELQQDVVYVNPTYDLRDIYVADEKEKQDAEKKVASLQQQLEQAGTAHKVAVASSQQQMQQAQAQFSTVVQVGLYF